MFEIINRGQAIIRTDYWTSEHAKAGYCYLTWNAGAARILIPDAVKHLLRDMKGATEVMEDGSDEPFCLHLVAEQCDRLIPETDQGGGITVIAYTRGGEKGRWPARYRVAPEIPWLREWTTH